MKNLNDHYFVHFPEFFLDKDWGLQVYTSTSVEVMDFPKGINIIFTKSDSLETIKQEAIQTWEEIQNIKIADHIRQTAFIIARTLKHKNPESPKIKILFKEGDPETCEISENEKTLIIFVSGIKPPKKEKIWFYPADAFDI